MKENLLSEYTWRNSGVGGLTRRPVPFTPDWQAVGRKRSEETPQVRAVHLIGVGFWVERNAG